MTDTDSGGTINDSARIHEEYAGLTWEQARWLSARMSETSDRDASKVSHIDVNAPKRWRNRIVGYGEEQADQLLANAKNYRIHPKNQQDALLGVLHEVGIVQNIIVNQRTGMVVDGHLRAALALREGQKSIPVTYVDLSEAEESLVLATIDPISALAAADKEKLDALLRDVNTGEAAVQELLAGLAEQNGLDYGAEPPEAPEAQIDKAAELQEKWGTARGQLWEVGRHRVMCGDSTNAEDVARLMGGEKIILLATDPPYGVKLDQGWRDRIGLNRLGRSQDDKLIGDDRYDWSVAYELSKATIAVIWHAGIYADVVKESIERAGYEVLQQIIWLKNMAPLSRQYYHWKHEPAWFARRGHETVPWYVGRDQTTVWEAKSPKHIMSGSDEDKQDHPTQKPIDLWLIPITNHTKTNDYIYDPFLGSGTAIAAAEQLGRIGRGMEIEPKYVAVTLQRLADMGLDPKLVQ